MPATDRLDLLQVIASRPIVLDAAMGTRLIERGLELDRDDPALWVLDQSSVVAGVHQADIRGGADALLTNTFGANRTWLSRYGRERDCWSINTQAASIARRMASSDQFILGSIGPTASDHPKALIEQAEALVSGTDPVDALLLETHRLEQAESALWLLRHCRVPVIPSLFDWPEPIADAAFRLMELGAPLLGVNCVPGMRSAVAVARKLREICDLPLLVKPSATRPGLYPESPVLFEAAVPELIALGVRMVGGCCGSDTGHVRALRGGIDRLAGKV